MKRALSSRPRSSTFSTSPTFAEETIITTQATSTTLLRPSSTSPCRLLAASLGRAGRGFFNSHCGIRSSAGCGCPLIARFCDEWDSRHADAWPAPTGSPHKSAPSNRKTRNPVLAHLRRPQQSHAQRDHCEGENHRSGIDQGDRSAGFGGSGWKHREKETRGNENRSQWHSDSHRPKH